jgi:hypothetical protein
MEGKSMKGQTSCPVDRRFRLLFLFVMACTTFAATACTSGIKGTYSDQMGAFVLDIKSGDKAAFTFAGETADCSYKKDGTQLTLDCAGAAGKMVFTIHDDGSLTGPPVIPALRKRKS